MNLTRFTFHQLSFLAPVLLAAWAASAQPGVEIGTNDVNPIEMVISNVLDQLEELGGTNEFWGTNDPGAETGLEQTNGRDAVNGQASSSRNQGNTRESRRRWLQRQRSRQNGSGGSTDAAPTNSAAGSNGLDYASFRVIVDRNIFDPNRRPHRADAPPPTAPTRRTEYLTLVGTMSYEKGEFAFFDGASSQFQKALKLGDSVAGLKVTGITPSGVRLAKGTNEFDLRVGMQLRRDDEGAWSAVSQPRSYASSSGPGAAASSTPPQASSADGPESDILKKLMQRREQE